MDIRGGTGDRDPLIAEIHQDLCRLSRLNEYGFAEHRPRALEPQLVFTGWDAGDRQDRLLFQDPLASEFDVAFPGVRGDLDRSNEPFFCFLLGGVGRPHGFTRCELTNHDLMCCETNGDGKIHEGEIVFFDSDDVIAGADSSEALPVFGFFGDSHELSVEKNVEPGCTVDPQIARSRRSSNTKAYGQ